MSETRSGRGLTGLRVVAAVLAVLTVQIGQVSGRLLTSLVGIVVLVAALLSLAGVITVSRRRTVRVAVAVLLVVLMGYNIVFSTVPIGNPPGR